MLTPPHPHRSLLVPRRGMAQRMVRWALLLLILSTTVFYTLNEVRARPAGERPRPRPAWLGCAPLPLPVAAVALTASRGVPYAHHGVGMRSTPVGETSGAWRLTLGARLNKAEL